MATINFKFHEDEGTSCPHGNSWAGYRSPLKTGEEYDLLPHGGDSRHSFSPDGKLCCEALFHKDPPLPPEGRTINPLKYEPPEHPQALEAWDELISIGAPVLGHELGWGNALFSLSAECNGDPTHGGETWASYWEGYRVHPKVIQVLEAHGLWYEWINAGVVGIYEG